MQNTQRTALVERYLRTASEPTSLTSSATRSRGGGCCRYHSGAGGIHPRGRLLAERQSLSSCACSCRRVPGPRRERRQRGACELERGRRRVGCYGGSRKRKLRRNFSSAVLTKATAIHKPRRIHNKNEDGKHGKHTTYNRKQLPPPPPPRLLLSHPLQLLPSADTRQ